MIANPELILYPENDYGKETTTNNCHAKRDRRLVSNLV
jgi:hypothetical protein